MRNIIFTTFVLLLFSITSVGQPFNTRTQWEKYFKGKISELDPIEGIYSKSYVMKVYNRYHY